jgi:hypothetical protein
VSEIEERLRELQQLRANETITEEEYRDRRETILDQLSRVEAPSTKGLNALQRVYLILGVMALVTIVLFIGFWLFAVVLAVFPTGTGTSSMTGSISSYQAPSSSQVNNESIGAQVTIEWIGDPAISTTGEGKASTGKRYIAIQMAVENVGQRDLKAADFRLRTWDGDEFEPKLVPDIGASDLSFLKNVLIGERRAGVIAFEVPEGAAVQWLRFRSNPSGVEIVFGEE